MSNSPTKAEPLTMPSAYDVGTSVERFKKLITQHGLQLFAHIDHAAGAREVGLTLRPTQLLIFGNARGGTPLMQSQQIIGLDLPLRALFWEDASGKSWLTYHAPSQLAKSYNIEDRVDVVAALDQGLAVLARAATA